MYSNAGKVTPYLEFDVKSLVMSFSPTVGARTEESNNDERKRAPSEETRLKVVKSFVSSIKALEEFTISINL